MRRKKTGPDLSIEGVLLAKPLVWSGDAPEREHFGGCFGIATEVFAHMRLQPHVSAADALIGLRINAYEGLCGRIAEIERIFGDARIESLFCQVDLLLFEGGGYLDLMTDA